MNTALKYFELSMKRVRDLHALHEAFTNRLMTAIDLTDLLRAEIVLAVSALDYFVHEVARLGMLEIWSGSRSATNAFDRFPLPLSEIRNCSASGVSATIVESEIRKRLSYSAFQSPEKIAEAIRMISDIKLWEEVGNQIGRGAEDIKSELRIIVDRRNKIAHEADIDPTFPGQRWPINRNSVEGALAFIEALAAAIYQIVANPRPSSAQR